MTAPVGEVSWAQAIDALDWPRLVTELDAVGYALTPPIIGPDDCTRLAGLYDDDLLFRATVDMGPLRFGSGQYRYFADPIPETVASMLAAFWPHLLPVAREWAARLRRSAPWPDTLEDWLALCHAAGQSRPTPLMLRYGPGDWNALHRDLYGEMVFPLQIVIGLDRPGLDHKGGEFLLVEQRPRAQSRGSTVVVGQGQALVFTTRDRPVPSARGWSAAPVRHGVSTLRSGRRRAIGLILHDAT